MRRSLLAACEYTQLQRTELNRINVFPVPDGDTGTNLALTVQTIADHLKKNTAREFYAVADEAAQAAVLGARGNAGMMLSHFLLGFAEWTRGMGRISAQDFSQALRAGAERLQAALELPVEGTILTVMRDTARAALEAKVQDFQHLMDILVERARVSLARTPELLPPLKKAGVVDAGAKGFVHLLEGVVQYINGDPLVTLEGVPDFSGTVPAMGAVAYPQEREHYRYCTEALVRGPALPDWKTVQDRLRREGDSLIVIRSGEVLKVHVHTDEPEAVFAYLKTLGHLATHKAEDMQAQHAAAERAAHGHLSLARRPVGIITDSASDLPEEIIRAHGIKVVPLLLVKGDATYRDGVDVTAEEFHATLRDGGPLPTTSQPPPAAFLEAYRKASEEAEEVVGVFLGSNLSGTFRSAEAAASHFNQGRVHLVDSFGASLLTGLLVLKATELAELALPPMEIVAELNRIRRQSGVILTVDRMDRLLASGRVGPGRAWLAKFLRLKPILAVPTDGRPVAPAGKVIGRRRVLPAVLEILRREIPSRAEKIRFGVIHVGRPEIVDQVSEVLREEYGDVEILSAAATPVLATHTGHGAWAVSYLVED
ncbi:MAG: DegV family protein [Longimicrobiales bacterium]